MNIAEEQYSDGTGMGELMGDLEDPVERGQTIPHDEGLLRTLFQLPEELRIVILNYTGYSFNSENNKWERPEGDHTRVMNDYMAKNLVSHLLMYFLKPNLLTKSGKESFRISMRTFVRGFRIWLLNNYKKGQMNEADVHMVYVEIIHLVKAVLEGSIGNGYINWLKNYRVNETQSSKDEEDRQPKRRTLPWPVGHKR